jgi:hypothetical protein
LENAIYSDRHGTDLAEAGARSRTVQPEELIIVAVRSVPLSCAVGPAAAATYQIGILRVVCTENLILFDYVTESPNVNGNDRAALLPVVPENSIR